MGRARTFLVVVEGAFVDVFGEWVAADARLEVVGRASTGAQALERLGSLLVDRVLVDVSLPDMSGFEVARRIKSRADAPLVVLISFHDSHAARLEAWAAGADGFVSKSQTAECLIPLVGDLLRRRKPSVRDESSGSPTMQVPPTDGSK